MAARCISCMKQIDSPICPHCGYPEQTQNESHQLPVGTVLRGRYQLGKVLGQGGFGITYLAWDTLMRRAVAVKEFYPGGVVYRRSTVSLTVECTAERAIPHYNYSKERFLREASALVDFQDIPEIVDIMDFVEENNTAYIVMEFVRGVDLAKYIQRKGGKLTVDETFRILRPVMEALAKVHKGGIVHRDISPDNIILDPMGGAKLLDFGAVRAVEAPDVEKGLNKSTEAILKHGFAPMEQYNTRGSLGPWTDEYAMCGTVWYCLTGSIPEDASIRMSEGVDPDWSSIPGLPAYQQKALAKGFSCRAKDRYPDMDSFILALFPKEISVEIKNKSPQNVIETIPEQSELVGQKCIPSGKVNRKKTPFFILGTVAVISLVCVLLFALGSSGKKIDTSVQDTSITTQIPTESTMLPVTEPTVPPFEVPMEYRFPKETISAGNRYTVGLREDGTVLYAGFGLGPTEVTSWQDIIAISANEEHTAGLKSDGTVVAAGRNGDGECNVSSWKNIAAISTGGWHTVGLQKNGTVVATGRNYSNQCDVSSWQDIVAISAGSNHTVGLKKNGTVVAVGLNSGGQCNVSSWQDIVAISAGYSYTIGLKADGSVVIAGGNHTLSSSWTDIVAINSKDQHAVGIKKDGTVIAYIEGGSYYERNAVTSWEDIVSVSMGFRHIVGLKSDGTPIAVGENFYGQCDISNWTNLRLPDTIHPKP